MTRAEAIAWGAIATARATHLRSDGHGDAAAVLDGYVTALDADLDSEDAREEPGMVAEMLRVIA